MPEIYRSPHTGTIADLIGRRGQSAAQTARVVGDAAAQRAAISGQAWGNAIQNIGQTVSGTLADFAQYRADAPNRALKQQQSDLLAKQLGELETTQAQTEIGKLAQMVKASGYDPSTAEPIFRAIGTLTPEYAEPLMRSLMEPDLLKRVTDTLISQMPGYKAPEGFTLSEGQTRFGPSGEPLANVPKPEPPAQPFTLGEGQVRYGPSGEQIASGPPKTDTPVNLQAVDVLLDGKEVKAVFNPRTGTYSRGGVDVTDRVQVIPKQPPTPTQRFSPREITIDGKSVTANYDALTGKYHDVDTGAVLKNVEAAPTADMRNKAEGRKLVKTSIEAIETLSRRIITKVGPQQRAEAIARGTEAVFGNDPEFRTYQDARMALAGNLAVAQQGSRPSDADIRAIWLPLVPDPYRDTKESNDMKWRLIKEMSNVSDSDADTLSTDPNAGQPIQRGSGGKP